MEQFKIETDNSNNIFLTHTDSKIHVTVFALLTGCKLDFNKRINKYINIYRKNGHIYYYDEDFILNEKYIKDNKEYTCTHISDNIALLSEHNTLKVISSTNPTDFRIKT